MVQGTDTKRVLITGAAGNLGRRLTSHLAARGGYELVLLDRMSEPASGIIAADLSRRGDWEPHFAGVHCVVHLAAEALPHAPWQSLLTNNVVATINVFEAAATHGASRLVFASSLHTVTGYEEEGRRVVPEMPTRPLNLYGVTKVIGEELARGLADRHGVPVVCLRLGWVFPGNARPRPGVDALGKQRRWLSGDDFCQACEKAILVAAAPFRVVFVTSKVEGSIWDLSAAARELGYAPRDTYVPVPPSLWRRVRLQLRRIF